MIVITHVPTGRVALVARDAVAATLVSWAQDATPEVRRAADEAQRAVAAPGTRTLRVTSLDVHLDTRADAVRAALVARTGHLSDACRELEDMRSRRDAAIHAALNAGASFLEVETATGLTRTRLAHINRRETLRP